MTECTAAMVLMSLSASPKSPKFSYDSEYLTRLRREGEGRGGGVQLGDGKSMGFLW